jgi:radical SAM-linked protein
VPTIRIRYAKLGKIRWTSHRDTCRMWERAFRRLALPVMHSEGFSPRPRLHFGLALSTGHESVGEYLDVDLARPTDLGRLPAELTAALPVGIDVQAAVALDAPTVSLQADVTACRWLIEVTGVDAPSVAAAADAALASDTIMTSRTRKGVESVDDIRPAILALTLVGERPDGGALLAAELATQPRGLRPAELLAAVLPPAVLPGAEEARVVRTHQWIERDGARREPIPHAATSPWRVRMRRDTSDERARCRVGRTPARSGPSDRAGQRGERRARR